MVWFAAVGDIHRQNAQVLLFFQGGVIGGAAFVVAAVSIARRAIFINLFF